MKPWEYVGGYNTGESLRFIFLPFSGCVWELFTAEGLLSVLEEERESLYAMLCRV